MKDKNEEVSHTVRTLKWIEQYPGWWYLICTPGDEHMTLEMMRTLMKKLHEAALDELIFVLLTVHRGEAFMETFFPMSLLNRLIHRWEEDREQILSDWLAHFE